MVKRDYGLTYTEKELKLLERRIKAVYEEAVRDMTSKLNDFTVAYQRKDAIHRQELAAGKITKLDYDDWVKGQVFQGQLWRTKREQLAMTLYNANSEALKIINGGKISVFAQNMNWTAYDLEHTAGLNFGFNLYDSTAVTRLIKDDPKILPFKQVDKIKDKRWNFKSIKNQITQGIIQGERIDQIADRIANVTGSQNQKQMLRTARTAMTSAQNGGRLERLKEAEKLGLKIHKEWMCTLDERTRDTHRKLDGQKQKLDKPFKVDGYEIDFPGDPYAHPSLVYNCRCTLVADFDDYPAEYERYDQLAGKPIKNMTYQEWAKAKGLSGKEQPWTDQIRAIQSRVALNGLTEVDVMEAGQIFADEMDTVYADAEKQISDAEVAVKNAEMEYYKAYREYNQLRNKIDADITLLDDENIQEKIIELDNYMQLKDKKLYQARQHLRSLEYLDDKAAKDLKNKLGEIREVGYDGLDVKRHLSNSRSKVRKNVEYAYDKYPKSWVEQSVAHNDMDIKKVERGYYWNGFKNGKSEIAISGWVTDASFNETAIHELGHRFEHIIPDIREQEKIFYERRTAGEDLKWLGRGYGKGEKTRKDEFLDSYMGKDYGGDSYELVSMGFQLAYTNPLRLKADKDMQQWILGLLAIVP